MNVSAFFFCTLLLHETPPRVSQVRELLWERVRNQNAFLEGDVFDVPKPIDDQARSKPIHVLLKLLHSVVVVELFAAEASLAVYPVDHLVPQQERNLQECIWCLGRSLLSQVRLGLVGKPGGREQLVQDGLVLQAHRPLDACDEGRRDVVPLYARLHVRNKPRNGPRVQELVRVTPLVLEQRLQTVWVVEDLRHPSRHPRDKGTAEKVWEQEAS
mmetsp:Transcript_5404/g.16365  ORF Transcript_5404/g.16365 Transcript_5404/m.16365 type:complete len:214 (-) Transcript_5404:447-1088(-)